MHWLTEELVALGHDVTLFASGDSQTSHALFCNDAQISKAYPSESDVWKLAYRSGLVVDVSADEERPGPRRVLDNDYEIRPCRVAQGEDPPQNKAEADRQSTMELELLWPPVPCRLSRACLVKALSAV